MSDMESMLSRLRMALVPPSSPQTDDLDDRKEWAKVQKISHNEREVQETLSNNGLVKH